VDSRTSVLPVGSLEDGDPRALRPLRVTYLIDHLGMGGAERLLAPALNAMRDQGVEPRLVALKEKDGNPLARVMEDLGYQVTVVGLRRLVDPAGIRRLAAILRAQRPDVIHAHLETSTILGGLVARSLHVPLVTTIHTLEKSGWRSRAAARRSLLALAMRHLASRVVAVSSAAAAHHARDAAIPGRRLVTIWNGIDPAPFVAASAVDGGALRRRLGLPSGPLLLTVAVLRPEKGIEHMIAAIPRLMERVPDVTYAVAGEGPHRDALLRAARDEGVESRVMMLGHRDDVPELLAACDCFVLPSLTEALPTVIAEAFFSGRPVVATDVGGVGEMVRPEETGLLVRPSDSRALAAACARVLEDPAFADRLVAGASILAQSELTAEAHAIRLRALYEEVVA
jgi:glycosyltransferase involved in cell wall biosynthesis